MYKTIYSIFEKTLIETSKLVKKELKVGIKIDGELINDEFTLPYSYRQIEYTNKGRICKLEIVYDDQLFGKDSKPITMVALSVELHQLPHCCGIAVISNIQNCINSNKGLGQVFYNDIESFLKLLKFTVIMNSTIVENNNYLDGINFSTKNKFQSIFKFLNKRSGNNVQLSIKYI